MGKRLYIFHYYLQPSIEPFSAPHKIKINTKREKVLGLITKRRRQKRDRDARYKNAMHESKNRNKRE